MNRKRAKILTAEQLAGLLAFSEARSSHPVRDAALILLSFRGGLRAAEIAQLTWSDVTDAMGGISRDTFAIPRLIAKKGHARSIPMHPELYAALKALQQHVGPRLSRGREPLIRGASNIGPLSPNALQRYFGRLYRKAGFDACSSHSGRRSFITVLARRANNFGCSLRDVQVIAGHRFLDTTEKYIEPGGDVTGLVQGL